MRTGQWEGRFVRGPPNLGRLLRGFQREDAGALALLSPCARDTNLHVTPIRASRTTFQRALKVGRTQGALAARIHHGTGRIPAGRPMVALAALARSRKDAMLAVESMLNALKGVATRWDEP